MRVVSHPKTSRDILIAAPPRSVARPRGNLRFLAGTRQAPGGYFRARGDGSECAPARVPALTLPEPGARMARDRRTESPHPQQDVSSRARHARGQSARREDARMASQKLVRCEIRRRGASSAGTARFIPLEIFGLWEYLMTTKHDFEVVTPKASLWLDMEDSPEAAYSENQYDRVTEVSAFVYSG